MGTCSHSVTTLGVIFHALRTCQVSKQIIQNTASVFFRTIPSVFRELGGCCYLSPKFGLDFEFFRKKKKKSNMRRKGYRKIAFLDSYHRRKKDFGFVFKKCSMIGSHNTSHFSDHKSWLRSSKFTKQKTTASLLGCYRV